MSENCEKVIFEGDSNEVTPVRRTDYNDYIVRDKKHQGMKGFDSDYRDFVEYIIKITHKIWEEKSIGLIYDTYSSNIVMHLGSFNATGIQGVIAGTMQTLFSFPDRRLIGQDVIWSPHGENGYLSSHRILSTATNLNQSSFGPATGGGKRISFRTTVDCAAENNRIYEEWLVRDNLWIVRQLGFDVYEAAKKLAKSAPRDEQHTNLGMSENMRGQLSPELHQACDGSVGEFMLEMLSRVYNYRLFDEVKKYYTENATVHFICDQDMNGHSQIQGMLMGLFASFPNAAFVIERVTSNQIADNAHSVAVRWRINGVHEGIGYFGMPSGKPMTMLGISHYTVADGKICEEWMTFDGLDVLKQLVNVEN